MQEIYIGVDNPNYLKFDDGEVLGAYPFPHIISKIDVEFNQSHVIGVNVTYKVGNGQFVSGQSSLKFKNTPAYVKTFIVPEGDFLSEINGCFENVINSIGFVTYKGYKETFGNPIGVSFRHFSPQNTFTAAKGSFDKWLNFIAFRVVPLPPYAMQQFYPGTNQNQQMNQVPPQQPLQQQPPPQYPYPSNNYPPQQQQQQYPPQPPNQQGYVPPPPPMQQGYVPPPPPPMQQGYVPPPPPMQQGYVPPPPPPGQQPYTPYPSTYTPPYTGYPGQQPYPYPTYQPYPQQNSTTIVEVIDTNPYGGGYNSSYNNYYNQRPGMGVGAAMGLGMLTGMAVSDLTHHNHHGGIYDVNIFGGHHHHHHRY